MKKQVISKTESKIKQAIPDIEIDPELSLLSEDLDKLEIWSNFKNSDIGREFYEEIGKMCAGRINIILTDHRKLGDSVHDYLSEVNALVSLLNKMDKAENELPELQEEIDGRVEQIIKITRKNSNGSNAGF